MDIGLRLRNLREAAGLTQQEVGKKIGVTKATVNRYETGEIDIKRTIAIKLADVLKSTPAYIMGWDDTSPKRIDESTIPNLDDSDTIFLHMYKRLDAEDKAEIRGEIKQMLKADKYSKIEDDSPSEYFEIAAKGGTIMQSPKKKFETTL